MARIDKNFVPEVVGESRANSSVPEPNCWLEPIQPDQHAGNFAVDLATKGATAFVECSTYQSPDAFCELLKQAGGVVRFPNESPRPIYLESRPQPDAVQRMEELTTANERLRATQRELTARLTALELNLARNTVELDEDTHDVAAISRALSNDLRDSVRGMTGLSQLLLAENAGSLGERGRECAKRIAEAGLRLDRFIQNLVRYGTVTCGKPVCEVISLESSISAAVGERMDTIVAKRAEVHSQHPFPRVLADASLLQSVLGHLLDNALTYVAPGVMPRVRLWTENSPATVRLYVEDNGVGIAAEYHERVFGLFERYGNEHPGAGVGLALVRKALKQMNGASGVESAPGAGSRFWIELPKPH
jgi:signal transduction histidine kinase